ncbi:hypothetical protein N7461_001554 [Penicillium sp. DV-2018c]|nr:hypothetical protein N7461_001554 [Penicillium sp. DV-2018c]
MRGWHSCRDDKTERQDQITRSSSPELSGYPSKGHFHRVRDALKKDTERRKEEIRKLNKDVIHGGDVRSDAMVVTERYKKSSTEWQSFRTLYIYIYIYIYIGLTPDNVHDLGIVPCYPISEHDHPFATCSNFGSHRRKHDPRREQLHRFLTWMETLPPVYTGELDGIYTTTSTLLIFQSAYVLFTDLAGYPGVTFISDMTSPNRRENLNEEQR